MNVVNFGEFCNFAEFWVFGEFCDLPNIVILMNFVISAISVIIKLLSYLWPISLQILAMDPKLHNSI